MAAKTVSSKKALVSTQELVRGFVIFSVIYFPVSVLFINNGKLEELILTVFTSLLALTGLILIAKYLWIIGEFLNKSRTSLGDLFRSYFTMAFLPLCMFKIFAYNVLQLLPTSNTTELYCDTRRFVLGIYQVTDPQLALNYLILGSLVFIGLLAIRKLTLTAN